MLPLMLNLYVSRLKEAGAPLHPRIDSELKNHLGYVDGALKGREFFVGTSLTGADIQMSFVGEMAKVFDKLAPYPNLTRLADADACAAGVPALGREGRGVPVCEITRSGVVPASARKPMTACRVECAGWRTPSQRCGHGVWAPAQGRGDARRARAAWSPIPTISCINISHLPQVLGRRRPIWYLAGTASDRHP